MSHASVPSVPYVIPSVPSVPKRHKVHSTSGTVCVADIDTRKGPYDYRNVPPKIHIKEATTKALCR